MQTSGLRSLSRVNARIIRTQFARFASTSETPVVVARPIKSGSTLKTTALVLGTGLFIAYYYDSRSAIHRWAIPPLMRVTLEPETAHWLALRVLRSPLAPKDQGKDDEVLKCTIWDLQMPSPVGLAAGFDKDGEAIDGLFGLGFDWVEIGSVTPKPQSGNPKPRVFTLPEDDAMINRYGFPSQGHSIMLSRLRRRTHTSSDGPRQILAVNLGKNKSSPPDSVADYVDGVRRFGAELGVDALVINVSSPNTPGLRGLQNRGMLEELLDAVCKERDAIPVATAESDAGKRLRSTRPKIILKIAPDLDELAIQDVAEAVRESGADGVIVSNTTIQRPNLKSTSAHEIGGLSGTPLFPLSLKALKILRAHLPENIPIIGCGGISSGAEALEFARAGASCIQLYTAFGYNGVGTAQRIKDELTEQLHHQNTTWNQIVTEAKSKAWVKPQGQKALDEGEQELRDMLDVLGKEVSGGEVERPSGEESQLDEIGRVVDLAGAAIASGPRGHESPPQALSLPQKSQAALPAAELKGSQPADGTHEEEKGALEKRRSSS